MLNHPPLSLSSNLQKTEGESKFGLSVTVSTIFARGGSTHQHIKSTLPSTLTNAQVCMLPIKP